MKSNDTEARTCYGEVANCYGLATGKLVLAFTV